jgi:hypothetical protein
VSASQRRDREPVGFLRAGVNGNTGTDVVR